jgi:predicted nucleic acid-binding Zn ribbon protein
MQSIKDLLPAVFEALKTPEMQGRTKLTAHWAEIAGPRIAAHTRPSLSKDGKLFVWVDQSTLAFELSQKYGPSLLKRAQALLGEEMVKSIGFRVGQLRG